MAENINLGTVKFKYEDFTPEQLEELKGPKHINIIPDPHFELGKVIGLYSKYPTLGDGTSSLNIYDSKTGILTIGNSITSRKAFNVFAKFADGWADKFNVVDGSKLIFGCYVKYEAANIETATLEQWGSFYDNRVNIHEVPYTPQQNEMPAETTPLDDFVWMQRTVTVRQGGIIQDINKELNFSIAFWRLTDPDATVENPSKIHIKNPVFIVNAVGDEQGFYETYRTNSLIDADYVKTTTLEVDDFIFKNLQTSSNELDIDNATNIDARQISSNILKLKENYSFPSEGNYIGYENTEPAISEDGNIIYIANREYTLDEWNALTEDEKNSIGLADIVSENYISLFSPVLTVTQWNALTEEEQKNLESVDIVEG